MHESSDDEAVLRIDEHHEIDLARCLPRRAGPDGADAPALPPGLSRACAPSAARSSTAATHDHGGDEIDPRLAGLAALLTERNGDHHD